MELELVNCHYLFRKAHKVLAIFNIYVILYNNHVNIWQGSADINNRRL